MNLPHLLQPISIGSCQIPNRLIAAPMAGITDLPFRIILKSYGVGLTFSEMVSAEAFIRKHQKTRELIQRSKDESPFAVQLFGCNPDTLTKAARQLEEERLCDLIDINLGCPVRKVMHSGSGASLVSDPRKLFEAVERMVDAVSLPVTVKMRACDKPGDLKGISLIPELFRRGIRMVSLHARCTTWDFSHTPDWSWITLAVKAGRPIIGNGGIFTPTDAVRMVKKTGCDGIMVARGMLGNPWIFRGIQGVTKTGKEPPVSLDERIETMKRHLSLSVQHFGEPLGVLRLRKHLGWYVRGLPHSSDFRGKINQLKDKESVLEEIQKFKTLIVERSDRGEKR